MTRAQVAVAAALAALACVDPVVPRAAVPTQDDVGADGFVAVSVGLEHSCALAGDGAAWCWGSNEFGQLGSAQGQTRCRRDDRNVPCETLPRPVSGGLRFQRIAAGGSHTCALGLDSRVYCWGDNVRGQLGDPAVRQSASPSPVASTALFTSVATGDAHACAVRSDNVAMCWGANDIGQLGLAVVGPGSASPVVVQTSQRFASIAAGDRRTCARTADGTTYCWGSTWFGRSAADGSELVRAQAQPQRVLGAPPLQQITVGALSTCGLGLDGLAWCWEANPTGTLGDGTTTGSTIPDTVRTAVRFTSLAAGRSQTCGVADNGYAFCWGSDASGQLGVPPSQLSLRCGRPVVPCYLTPVQVSGWRRYSMVAAGLGDHVCALTLAGNVYCWGAGSMGQRGDGSRSSLWSPTRPAFP